mgnify:CR=1 FL=1
MKNTLRSWRILMPAAEKPHTKVPHKVVAQEFKPGRVYTHRLLRHKVQVVGMLGGRVKFKRGRETLALSQADFRATYE